ncbi:MAG: peptide deformylase [Candidatus Marinimicrobia bacterium]|jgi:peptide deformylase|nr:peptide deformylase [Candidatus Neomarinimicrobiota bacterium]
MNSHCELRIYPDSVLRGISRSVENIDNEVRKLINEMKYIMYKHNGIGLAAPQVGILKRIFIADIGNGLFTFVNPVITKTEGQDHLIEGCLSLPGIGVDIRRHQKVAVIGLNLEGEEIRLELSGLPARVAQHEIDHLNGVLIIDYQEKTVPDKQKG